MTVVKGLIGKKVGMTQVFTEDGSIASDGTRKFLTGLMAAFAAWIERTAG